MKVGRIGVDLAKSVFQLHGVDVYGKAVVKKRLPRSKWLSVLCELAEPGCEIGLEACGGAHHWARQLQARGYLIKVIAENRKPARDQPPRAGCRTEPPPQHSL